MKSLKCLHSLFRTFSKLSVQIDWSSVNSNITEEFPPRWVHIGPDAVHGSFRSMKWSTFLVKDVYYIDHIFDFLHRIPIVLNS